MLPSPSIAYQPALMPRMSDLCSLMYWGAITVSCSCAQQIVRHAGLTAGEFTPGSIAQAQIVVAGDVPADGTSAANYENGDFGGSRFYGQLFR